MDKLVYIAATHAKDQLCECTEGICL